MADYELKPLSAVKCQKCKVLGKVFPDYYEQGDGKGKAIEFWNRRADNG